MKIDTRINALKYIKTLLPKNPITCEIGFFKGEFSKEIYEILNSSEHYVIDTFVDINHISGDKDGQNYQSQDMTIMFEHAKSLGYKPYKGNSDILKEIQDKYLDFIYIDADHNYEWVKKDLNNSLPKIKKGGIISGHDYNFPGCDVAVHEFCNQNKLEINILTEDGCPSFFIYT